MNYYRLLTSSDTSWMAKDDAPFRFPIAFNNIAFVQCDLRHFKRHTPGRLIKPVVENPTVFIPTPGGRKQRMIQTANSKGISPRDQFNESLERCIKSWHEWAIKNDCDHSAPFLRLRDDSLAALFR